ncbi:HTH_48 domain-containing protein [Trichonephila clavipes]|nr:HTH_48 domain-containing protein [Trichonephila clavipes]
MEVARVEQRAYIKITILQERNEMECHSELVEALGNNVLSYRTVSRWIGKFQQGRVSTSDEQSSMVSSLVQRRSASNNGQAPETLRTLLGMRNSTRERLPILKIVKSDENKYTVIPKPRDPLPEETSVFDQTEIKIGETCSSKSELDKVCILSF